MINAKLIMIIRHALYFNLEKKEGKTTYSVSPVSMPLNVFVFLLTYWIALIIGIYTMQSTRQIIMCLSVLTVGSGETVAGTANNWQSLWIQLSEKVGL